MEGRLIACRVGRGKRKQWLYLFTTWSRPAAEVVALYGRRWNIETDLRSLKHTVRLQRIATQSAEMMEKELLARPRRGKAKLDALLLEAMSKLGSRGKARRK